MCPAVALAGEMRNRAISRPDEGQGPTQVQFIVFVVDIYNIDGVSQSFTTHVYIRLWWEDKRLSHSGTSVQRLPLDKVWNPRIVLVKQKGFIRMSLPEKLEVKPDGTVIYHQVYDATISQPLNLSEFPVDRQRFKIQFSAVGYTDEEVLFVPGNV
jgi:hypothetical protein